MSLDEEIDDRKIRQLWVEDAMKKREHEFTDLQNVTIFNGTYNVNSKKEDGDLRDWLFPHQNSGLKTADIYAIGFQEIVDLNAVNVAVDGSKTSSRAQYWEEKLNEALNARQTDDASSFREKYVMITSKHLIGLLLCVFVNEKYVTNGDVSDVRSTSTAVGILGVMGNKGGVCIRMNVFESSLCFVCSHLAAHRENIINRNSDYHTILEKTVFTADTMVNLANDRNSRINAERQRGHAGRPVSKGWVERPKYGKERSAGRDLSIVDHDIIVWLGDLNYRIDERMSNEYIFNQIEKGQLAHLANYDQLNIERFKCNVFFGFLEGELNFNPTYKYETGTTQYDRRNPNKIRAPAWCDRILWRCQGSMYARNSDHSGLTSPASNTTDTNSNSSLWGEMSNFSGFSSPTKSADGTNSTSMENSINVVSLLSYSDCDTLISSDHRPVYAELQTNLQKIIPSKERIIYEELIGDLEGFRVQENVETNVDKLHMEPNIVQFEEVRFNHFYEAKVLIRNTGTSLAHWHCQSKLESSSNRICKRWLHLSKTSGLLFPHTEEEVSIYCYIDMLTAQKINAGRETLYDVISIKLANSDEKVSNIHVQVNYQKSCYGMSLQELVLTKEPVRNTELPAPPVDVYKGALSGVIVNNNNNNTDGEKMPPNESVDLLGLEMSPQVSRKQAVTTSDKDVKSKDNEKSTKKSKKKKDGGRGSVNIDRMFIPKELWRLVDLLWQLDAFEQEGIFRNSAQVNLIELAAVREALDTGTEFPPCTVQTAVEALSSFLQSLPKPLLSPDLYPKQRIDPSQIHQWCKSQFLELLPPLRYNVFVYILSFMREVLAHEHLNKSHPTKLALFCIQCMTGLPNDNVLHMLKMQSFNKFLMDNNEENIIVMSEMFVNHQRSIGYIDDGLNREEQLRKLQDDAALRDIIEHLLVTQFL